MMVGLVACGASEAEYKLGMGVSVSTDSSSTGKAQIDATAATVVLDSAGKIVLCRIDCAQNKMDVTGAQDNLDRLREALKSEDVEVFPVSAAMVKGFDALIDCLVKTLDTLPKTYEFEEEGITETHRYEPGFNIEKDGDVFVVTGGSVDYILDTTYADDEGSMRRFQQFLIREGIIDALRKAGATEESVVRMGEWEFDFIE